MAAAMIGLRATSLTPVETLGIILDPCLPGSISNQCQDRGFEMGSNGSEPRICRQRVAKAGSNIQPFATLSLVVSPASKHEFC